MLELVLVPFFPPFLPLVFLAEPDDARESPEAEAGTGEGGLGRQASTGFRI